MGRGLPGRCRRIFQRRERLPESVDPLEGVMPNLKIVVIEGTDHMNAFGNEKFIGSLREFFAANSAFAAAGI